MGLYMLCGEDEPGAEIYNAAADREQARISFDIAKKMIANDPVMRKSLEVYRDSVVRPKNWGRYKVISSDAETKHGYNSQCLIIDELHAFKSRDLYDVLVTSTGARRQPLTLIITTAGYDRKSICYEVYKYAKSVRDGKIKDESFLPVIYEADEDDDPFDEKTWIKANPGYNVTIKKDYLQTEANKAQVTPSALNTFKRLHLNIWTRSETAWIPVHTWNACNYGELPDLSGRECFIGIDLASIQDLCAMAVFFPDRRDIKDEFKRHQVVMYYWVTHDKASDRKTKNEADYFTWMDQGFVQITPGNVQDYQKIRQTINEISAKYQVKTIGYDTWNSSQFAIDLAGDGANIKPWTPNNWALWNAPTKKLEELATGGNISHAGNPVLAWNIDNVVIRYNGEYIRPDKGQSKDKIDGVMALIVAVGEWMGYKEERPKPNGLGF